MACILLWSSAVRVHDSQVYRKMDMTRECISRILELKEITPIIPNWFQPCQCYCCLCYPGQYFRLGTFISYNWAQVLEACDCLKLLSIYFDLCVDATGVVCHQLSLLGRRLWRLCWDTQLNWKWGATTRYYASHTKAMLPMRKSVPRSSRQLDHPNAIWPS